MGKRRAAPSGAPRAAVEYLTESLIEVGRRACVYARFSDDDQNVLSIDRQVTLARARASKMGFVITAIYADEAKTGTSLEDRPGYEQMMKDARAKRFDHLIVESVSRAHRVASAGWKLFEEFEYLGLTIHDKHKELDNSAFNDQTYRAREELADLKQRCSDGRLEAAKHGKISGKNSYGFDIDGHSPGEHVVVQAQADIVREIFARLANKETPTEVADDLNARGVPSPRVAMCLALKRSPPAYEKGIWTEATIRMIIRNPLYKGLVIFGRTQSQPIEFGKKKKRQVSMPESAWIKVPKKRYQLVAEELWNTVNRIYDDRQMKSRLRVPNSCLFTGLLHCNTCGSKLHAKKDWLNRTVYRCDAIIDARAKASCPGCGSVQIERIERTVLTEMRERLLTPSRIAFYAEAYAAQVSASRTHVDFERDRATARLAELKAKLGRTLDPSATAGLDEDDLLEVRQGIKVEIAAVKGELAKCNPPPDMPAFFSKLGDLAAGFDELLSRLPFRPVTQRDLDVVYAIRGLIKGIIVSAPTSDGYSRLELAFGFPDEACRLEGGAEAPPLPKTVVMIDNSSLDLVDAAARTANEVARLTTLANWGRYDVSDQAWSLALAVIRDKVPKDRSLDAVRKTIDGILFAMHNQVPWNQVPDRYGVAEDFRNIKNWLSYNWLWDDIVEAWSAKCPSVLAGADVYRLDYLHTPKSTRRKVVADLPDARQLRRLAEREVNSRRRERILVVAAALTKPTHVVAAEFGVDERTLKKWMDAFRSTGEASFLGTKAGLTDEQKKELACRYNQGAGGVTLKELTEICLQRYGIRYKTYKSLFSALKAVRREN